MPFLDLFRKRTPAQATRLSPEAFLERRTEHDIVIDVRTPQEYSQGHLKGARNIDLAAFDAQMLTRSLDPGHTYYLYCRSGNRSGQATQILRELGYEAYNIGGLGELTRAGLEVL